MSRTFLLLLLLVLACSPVSLWAQAGPPPAAVSTNATAAPGDNRDLYLYDDAEDVFTRLEHWEKPARFGSWGSRLDYIQNNLTAEMQGYIDMTDRLMVSDPADLQPIPNSRFQFGTYMEFADDRGFSLKFDPNFKTDIKLPNIERKLKLFVDTAGSAELPGTTVTERDPGLNAGLRRSTRNFNIDAGVKFKWLPEVFGRVDWRPRWIGGGWNFLPLQRFYWESEDGYGSISSLDINKLLARHWLVKSTSAVRWREKVNDDEPEPEDPDQYYPGNLGFEWEQSVVCAYIRKVMSAQDAARVVNVEKTADAVGLRFSAFGHTEGDYAGPDRYRVTAAYRRPIYRNWIFFTVAPEAEWYKEDNWEFVPRIRMGFDMLFQTEAIGPRMPGS